MSNRNFGLTSRISHSDSSAKAGRSNRLLQERTGREETTTLNVIQLAVGSDAGRLPGRSLSGQETRLHSSSPSGRSWRTSAPGNCRPSLDGSFIEIVTLGFVIVFAISIGAFLGASLFVGKAVYAQLSLDAQPIEYQRHGKP